MARAHTSSNGGGRDFVAAFASVHSEVLRIRARYSQEMRNAGSPAPLQQAQQRMQLDLDEAIRRGGLTWSEYEYWEGQLDRDPEFRERVRRAESKTSE